MPPVTTEMGTLPRRRVRVVMGDSPRSIIATVVKGLAGIPIIFVNPKMVVRHPSNASLPPVRAVAVPGSPALKIILTTIAAMAAILVFLLPRVVERMNRALDNIDEAISNIESHTAEFTPSNGFVYFTDVNDPIKLDVNLKAGRQTLDSTMDNGEKLCAAIRAKSAGKP